MERRNGWINVGDLNGAVHFKIVKFERIKFLVIALRESIEIYAWAPKPYHKFMAFKVGDVTVCDQSRSASLFEPVDLFVAVLVQMPRA